MSDVKDITIIGAGPTGLFAAFYVGMRSFATGDITTYPGHSSNMALFGQKDD